MLLWQEGREDRMLQSGKMLLLGALAGGILAPAYAKDDTEEPALQTPVQVDAEVCAS